LYISGALGAVEIVGDSNIKQTDRSQFDGKDFAPDGEGKVPYGFDRTTAIGRDIGKAALLALEQAEVSPFNGLTIAKTSIKAVMDNTFYGLLSRIGVLDVPFKTIDGKVNF